jgi:hypothetical protein
MLPSTPMSSRDVSVGIATRLRAGPSSSRGSIPSEDKLLSLLRTVQTGSGAHPASYAMGARS